MLASSVLPMTVDWDEVLAYFPPAELESLQRRYSVDTPSEALALWLLYPDDRSRWGGDWIPLRCVRRQDPLDPPSLEALRARVVPSLVRTPEPSVAFQRALAGAARDLSDVGERAARDSDRQTAIILRQRKIIGCTTTYANAHSRVFQELRPRVIIVEEAAEVLGPLVIGLLPPSVQHLVLIGDHQQLSPRVNDRLVDLHGLSVSEMERLALADTPYSILRVQNRMSHGNSKLLLDRYPFLMDGERTRGVEDPPILQGGPTFWDHCDPEEGHVRNIGEARRVVFLASILLGNGYEASQLAIISPYREQVLSIERMIKREDANHLLREVHVGTVDSFQGEEADVVFISLVRSNLTRKIGFLDNPQRKGVLSSRGRRVQLFFGNHYTMSSSEEWAHHFSCFAEIDRILSYLPLVCPDHPDTSCNVGPSFDFLAGIRATVTSSECLCVLISKVRSGWRWFTPGTLLKPPPNFDSSV